jgi:secernin
MCDTIVALGSATDQGFTLFGKNSDREPDEAQNIRIIPAEKYSAGAKVECTYITIPQVKKTARVLLCQPFWMFGAEMGANEYGVVIGNEAIFTREKTAKIGLTGMDLVRLGLERSHSAREALNIIIKLLEEYGQGGNCGYRYKLQYMNSFIIADHKEAYVLETVKKWWAWKKIKGIWSISNVISLRQDYDECSEGLIKNAVDKGYCWGEKDFDFRKSYSDKLMTWAAKGIEREKRSRDLLFQNNKKFTLEDFISILRDHGEGMNSREWSPEKSKATLCLHAKDPLIRRTQTVCSMVAKLGQKNNFYCTTGASNPCLSPFFPVFLKDTGIPEDYQEGGANYNQNSFWWQSEKFHRNALGNFHNALLEMCPLYRNFEEKMISSLEKNNFIVNQREIDEYFKQARKIVVEWGSRLKRLTPDKTNWFYRYYWHKYNKRNGII